MKKTRFNYIKFLCFACATSCCFTLHSLNWKNSSLNLENEAQPFVLKTQRIYIPEHPHAFNPSAIQWNGKILLCFRTYHPETKATDNIAFVYLNEQWEPISESRFIQFPDEEFSHCARRQDPKLLYIQNELYIVYNEVVHGEVRRMRVGSLHSDETGNFIVHPFPRLLQFDEEIKERSEKNWVPFDYAGKLHLARTIMPHRIVSPWLHSEICKTKALTSSQFQWNWGELRGGTPALLQKDGYLAFFHSSKSFKTEHSEGRIMPHYFIGAYIFSKDPPFKIIRISPKPIIGKNFYEGPAYQTWKPLRVVFPGSYLSDETHIWLFYGRQDHEIWVATLDKQALLNSLTYLQD